MTIDKIDVEINLDFSELDNTVDVSEMSLKDVPLKDLNLSVEQVKVFVSKLEAYGTTYQYQVYYHQYSKEVLIDDALYGIGEAINKERYQHRDGYCRFKEDLIEYLKG